MPRGSYQQLDRFELAPGFLGRGYVTIQLWWIVQALLFRPLPQACHPIRRLLLRLFGASIGDGVKIRAGVRITYPWNVAIGAHSWIGDDATLYSVGRIDIGANVVISQNVYLCSADHDYTNPTFPTRARPVRLEDEVWVASDVWVGPGVTIHRGAVVAARSTVTKDLPVGMVCMGTPCRPVKPRLKGDAQTARASILAHIGSEEPVA